MRKTVLLTTLCMLIGGQTLFAQEKSILIPKRVEGAPFKIDDNDDLFGQAFRWFLEGEVQRGADLLRAILVKANFRLDPEGYYIVAANFTDHMTPVGLFHGSESFLKTRMYGLGENNLYYIFITRTAGAPSFLSVMATEKGSPFQENLLSFISLFVPIPIPGAAAKLEGEQTWIDVRQFEIPGVFRKNSDISVMIKKELSDEQFLASAFFDNTSLEQWSFGIATAITTIDDVDITIGNDGSIIVEPKPNLDLATFGVVNYHFSPVDTRARSLATSFHLLFGARLAGFVEPIVGIGGGLPLGSVDLHLFAGYSIEFANRLKDGFAVGDKVGDGVDPFEIKVRGKPRFGLEIKFP